MQHWRQLCNFRESLRVLEAVTTGAEVPMVSFGEIITDVYHSYSLLLVVTAQDLGFEQSHDALLQFAVILAFRQLRFSKGGTHILP